MKGLPELKNEALFILRLTLGIIFMMHGAQKVLGLFGGQGLQATVRHFETHLAIPPAFAYTACFTEFFGGIALILGLFTRLAALGIGITMWVALWKVHLAHGFFVNWACKEGVRHGYEYNLALLAMSAALILMGGGSYSIDAKLFSSESHS